MLAKYFVHFTMYLTIVSFILSNWHLIVLKFTFHSSKCRKRTANDNPIKQ